MQNCINEALYDNFVILQTSGYIIKDMICEAEIKHY